MNDNSIKQKIITHIIENYNIVKEDLDEQVNLYEAGIVDSMGAFELAAFLEETFNVEFGEEHFFDQRFRSIQGIEAIIKEIQETE